MRLLLWYCDRFAWNPALRTLDDAPEAAAAGVERAVVAFIHVEPQDVESGASAETKLVKNAKWVARKWEVNRVVLHSFTHLGEEKADPEGARSLIESAQARLDGAGYEAMVTPYGYFLDLDLSAPGHPLARIYKEF